MINSRIDTGVHYEKETNGTITSYRNYLYAGPGNVVGVYTTRSDSSTQLRYFGKDHKGSVVLSTDETGSLAERLSFDAFGKRRNINGTDDPNDLIRSTVTHQGYTMQEMLDDGGMGLIDMNARIYDPLLGRFMSPDSMIQSPTNLQNLNRYSYVMNNPVSLIDPSGNFSIGSIGGAIGGFVNDVGNAISGAASSVGGAISSAAGSVGNFFSQHGALVGEILAIAVVSIATAGAADAALGAIGVGALGAAVISGAVAGAVAGGLTSSLIGGQFSWQAVAVGALTGAVSGGLSNYVGSGAVNKIVGGAIAGGATQWLAGAVQGHPSFQSFYQGAILGGAVSAALVGIAYLADNSENSAMDSDSDQNFDGGSDENQNSGDRAPAYVHSASDGGGGAGETIINPCDSPNALMGVCYNTMEIINIFIDDDVVPIPSAPACDAVVSGICH